jgi:arylsulfatase
MKAKNEFRSTVAHVIDIAPTILDLVGVQIDNAEAPLMSGRSLKPAFLKDGVTIHDELWFYHEGNRALRQGDWKIVHSNDSRPFPWASSREAADRKVDSVEWQLYNLSTDRAEQRDLSKVEPERVEAMVARWEELREKFLREAMRKSSQ